LKGIGIGKLKEQIRSKGTVATKQNQKPTSHSVFIYQYIDFYVSLCFISDNMWILKSQSEISQEIADRCKSLRLEQNLSQEEIAGRSGITLSTYRRFEREGSISLERLVSVIHCLGRISELEKILLPALVQDLDQIEKAKPLRKRSRAR